MKIIYNIVENCEWLSKRISVLIYFCCCLYWFVVLRCERCVLEHTKSTKVKWTDRREKESKAKRIINHKSISLPFKCFDRMILLLYFIAFAWHSIRGLCVFCICQCDTNFIVCLYKVETGNNCHIEYINLGRIYWLETKKNCRVQSRFCIFIFIFQLIEIWFIR